MFRKIRKVLSVIKYYWQDEETAVLHLLEDQALKYLDNCFELEIKNTEQIEDLIFHIRSYYEIPKVVKTLEFPDLKEINIKHLLKHGTKDKKVAEQYIQYMTQVEKQRAVERDFIFEHAKTLPFGFKL